jgi:hypothetical protein
MSNELYIPVSSIYNDEISESIAFNKIFSNQTELVDDMEDINMDNLYFIKKPKQKNTITFEDFDQFYKKLTETDGMNEIEIANYEKPSFNINLSQEKIFSSFEDEKFVNVLNPENVIKSKYINEEKIQIYNNNNDCTKNEYLINNEKIEEEKEMMKYINNNNKVQEINQTENIDNFSFTNVKPKNIKKKKQEEIFFPFNPGKGIQQCLKNYEESSLSSNNNKQSFQDGSNNLGDAQSQNPNKNQNSRENFENSQNSTEKNSGENEEDSIYTEQITNGKENILFKFTTKKYFINSNGKKRRIKKKRKFKSDDIRKKIKSRFHKTFKNIINENLKKAGSEKLFDFFPQCFIGNVSKKLNAESLDLTCKELILKDFVSKNIKEQSSEKNADYKKYKKNKEVLEYLENNPEICKKSGFDIIKDKKYKDLLNIYFSSGEFEDSIIRLKKENESKEYIQEYVLKAKNYVSFYSKYKNKNNVNEEENSDVEN